MLKRTVNYVIDAVYFLAFIVRGIMIGTKAFVSAFQREQHSPAK